jgi:hypothetical protein
MSTWTSEELDTFAAATELRKSTRRADGTLRRAVPIWVVRAGDSIYVRSYRGPEGGRFQIRQLRPRLRRPDDRRPRGRDHAAAHPATLKGPDHDNHR